MVGYGAPDSGSPTVDRNEAAAETQYGIKWPTRHDYETNASNGKPEVDLSMSELADDGVDGPHS